MALMDVTKSHFSDDIYLKIRKKLVVLKGIAQSTDRICPLTEINISLDILDALNQDSYPVADHYGFRKTLILTFFEKVNMEIDLEKEISDEINGIDPYLNRKSNRSFETMVSELHLRLWNCLKVAIKAIVPLAGTTIAPPKDTNILRYYNR